MSDRRCCTATSKQAGRRCRSAPIPGGSVCRHHGGAAPQVQAAARERLAALADPAIRVLGALLRRSAAPAVQLGAARDVLDRTLGRAPVELTVDAAPGYLRYLPADRLATMRQWIAEATAAAAQAGADA